MPGSVTRVQYAFKEFIAKESNTQTVMTNKPEGKKTRHVAKRSSYENCDNLKWPAVFFCLATEEKP